MSYQHTSWYPKHILDLPNYKCILSKDMPIHRKYYPKTSQCIKLNDIIWFSPLKKKEKKNSSSKSSLQGIFLWNEDFLLRVVSNSSCNLESYLGFLVKEEKTNLVFFGRGGVLAVPWNGRKVYSLWKKYCILCLQRNLNWVFINRWYYK